MSKISDYADQASQFSPDTFVVPVCDVETYTSSLSAEAERLKKENERFKVIAFKQQKEIERLQSLVPEWVSVIKAQKYIGEETPYKTGFNYGIDRALVIIKTHPKPPTEAKKFLPKEKEDGKETDN